MASRAREAVGPLYLFACLLLGGSVQGIWSNMLLQLIGVGLIAWAAAAKPEDGLARPATRLLIIVLLGLAVIAIQLIPLPASVWPHLGGRERIASGYAILGLETPGLPISLAPHETLAALLTLIPPIAMLCVMLRLRAYRASWLAIALVAAMVAGVLLGALQVSGGPDSSWYLYRRTNRGLATGFFANANHMANLLVISLPFLAALLASVRGAKRQKFSGAAALVGGTALVVVVGLALNRSVAGYALAIPVLVASALILIPAGSTVRRLAAMGSLVMLLAAVAALWATPIGGRSIGEEAQSSVQSRQATLATSLRATADLLPFGSGAGTFRSAYKLFEDHDGLERTIVTHVHNDYVEIAMETGIPGIIVLGLFLAWWAVAAWSAWRSVGTPFARAAAVASAAILAHSLVDFPLRTSAIAAVFAMCLGLLIERRPERRMDKSELRPTRHVVFE